MKITLTLSKEDAETLLRTLREGRRATFAHGMQQDARAVEEYVQKRVAKAKEAECRKMKN